MLFFVNPISFSYDYYNSLFTPKKKKVKNRRTLSCIHSTSNDCGFQIFPKPIFDLVIRFIVIIFICIHFGSNACGFRLDACGFRLHGIVNDCGFRIIPEASFFYLVIRCTLPDLTSRLSSSFFLPPFAFPCSSRHCFHDQPQHQVFCGCRCGCRCIKQRSRCGQHLLLRPGGRHPHRGV